jgi:hypothetical protein
MNQGVRAFTNTKFAEEFTKVKETGYTEFRRTVMNAAIAQYGISIASAATHFNHAKLEYAKANPGALEGLGRPEDKKGGRKPGTKNKVVEAPAVVVPTLYDVIKVKDGTVVTTGLTKEAAEALVAKAIAAKKAKLQLKEAAPAAVVAETKAAEEVAA